MITIDRTSEPLPDRELISVKELTFQDFFCDLIKGAPTSTFIMRKSVLNVIGCYDLNIDIDDFYIWLKITQSGCSIIHSSDIYNYYRQP